MFVLDPRTMAVTNALAFRMLCSWLTVWDVLRIIRGRGRVSMVMATGGHFASAVAAARLTRSSAGRRFVQVLSVHMPLLEIVRRLNAFRPVLVTRRPAHVPNGPRR